MPKLTLKSKQRSQSVGPRNPQLRTPTTLSQGPLSNQYLLSEIARTGSLPPGTAIGNRDSLNAMRRTNSLSDLLHPGTPEDISGEQPLPQSSGITPADITTSDETTPASASASEHVNEPKITKMGITPADSAAFDESIFDFFGNVKPVNEEEEEALEKAEAERMAKEAKQELTRQKYLVCRAKKYVKEHPEKKIGVEKALEDIIAEEKSKRTQKALNKCLRKREAESHGVELGEVRQESDYLPKLSPALAGNKRHHIIPIRTMQGFFQTIPHDSFEYDVLKTALAGAYTREWEKTPPGDPDQKKRRANFFMQSQQAESLDQEAARAKGLGLLSSVDIDESLRNHFYDSLGAWAPGNLVLGPDRGRKDPGDNFDTVAAKLWTKCNQAELSPESLENLYEMMRMYLDTPNQGLLDAITLDLVKLFSAQITDASAENWDL